MANIKISALPSVLPSGYTNDDLLVIVNYDVSSGTTKNTPLSGLTSYILSGVTFPTDYLPLSGGTVTGDTIFNQGLTANTISASIYLGLPLDVYVTGGTYSGGTITFTNNSGGTFTVSGLTFTGNTSGDCITDLFVKNLNSCSPLRIQNVSSGNVLIGENGGVNVGIGTSTPSPNAKLDVNGKIYSRTGGIYTDTINTYTGNDLFVIGSPDTIFVNNVEVMRIKSNGNVGINAPSPNAKLHINNTTSGNTFLVEDDTNPDSTPFLIDNLGNVGVGTLSPLNKLDVNGYINTNQGVFFNNSGFSRIIISNSFKFDGIFIEGFRFWNEIYDFLNYDNSGFSGDTFQIANSFIKGKNSGITDTSKYFAINVTGTPTSMLHVVGSDSSSSNFGLKVQDSGGTDNFVVRNDGNVGIGVANPNANLDIFYGNTFTSPKNLFLVKQFFSNREVFKIYDFGGSGGSQITSEYATWGFGMPADSPVGNRLSIKGNTSNSSTASIIVQDSSSNYTFILRDDGKVGIGTVSPSETLDVNGKTKTTNFQMTSGATTAGYVLTDSDGFGNAQWQVASGITGVGNVFKYTATTAFTASVTQTITHNLNTKFVHCSVWDSSDQLVTAQVVRTSGNQTNAVDITISTSGIYDILITG